MGAPGIGAIRQQQCRVPSRGPDVRFPPFVHSKGRRIRYQPYPELQKTFKSLINRLNCSKNVDTYRSILKEIKAAAADHGLYVASWVSNKTRNKIEGIILLEQRKSKARPFISTPEQFELLETISSFIDADAADQIIIELLRQL